ncbi:phospholipase A [Myroides odoratimimus]|uniref:phospholipase A n=1 Tax=Myroides odoratimimus TaxID=76832 RepID=UPI002575A4A8|nr:phospholipase A [Myroides odoratimimus]MDM1098114.1 phospholipase A [Myroides odoratimimus]MDM1328283.1 phospholipase A [Myroides odoratimimus]MDM1445002.1 phospholipase A [Myroides odoratimimus]MDM1451286.1 phospholipase A [Myroides odoratimimus]MDM1454418.1 phospholipase A [Myroides odoratimimus]
MKYKCFLLSLLVSVQVLGQEPDDYIFDNNREIRSLRDRWDLNPERKGKTFALTPYKPVYLLPARWSSKPNEMPTSLHDANSASEPIDYNRTEIRFQISFKTKVATGLFWGKGDIWLAFTQTANWQAYNEKESRPFRELNYEPEVIFNYPLDYAINNFKFTMAGIGFNHQSNGKSLPYSRSWNRITMHLGMEYHNWTFLVRPWFRLQEEADSDDNPRIEDYVGRGEAVIGYQHESGQLFTLMIRNNLKFNNNYKGFAEFTWAYPIKNNLKAFLVVNHGYGETMIDYNWKQTNIGLGISLMEWL